MLPLSIMYCLLASVYVLTSMIPVIAIAGFVMFASENLTEPPEGTEVVQPLAVSLCDTESNVHETSGRPMML